MNDDGKSLFFLILSLSCVWLILDMFYGKKYLSKLIDGIFGTDESVSVEKTTEIKNSTDFAKKNSTVSGATNNASFPYKTGEEQRKDATNSNKKNNSTGNIKNGSSTSVNPSTGGNRKPTGNTTGGSGTSAFPY